MMKRRLLASAAGMICATVALVYSVAAGQTPTTLITFWHQETPPHRVRTFQKIIDDFVSQNPGVNIRQETGSWADAYPRTLSAVAARKQPDMMFTNADLTMAVYQAGGIQVADDIVQEIDARYRYIPSQLVPYNYAGHYRAVPMWGMTINFYYNDNLIKEGGLDGPPRTWDEILTLCDRLKPKGMYAIAMPTSRTLWGDQIVHSFMVTNRAYIFDKNKNLVFDSPQTVQTFEFLVKLAKCTPPGSNTWAWGDGHVAYMSGKVATFPIFGGIRNWDTNAPAVSKATRTSFIPLPRGGERGSYSAPNAVMVFTRDSTKRAIIKKFLLFLMEPERNGWWLANMEPGTYVPITAAAAKARSFWEQDVIARHRQSLEMHIDNLKYGKVFGFEYGPNPKIAPIAGANVVAAAAQKLYLGEMTPAQAVKWGAEEMHRLIQ